MTKRSFMPWVIALLLFEFLFFMMPGINSTVNLFVVPVSTELEISRSMYSLSFAVASAVFVVISLFYGKIYEKLGARRIIFLTGVCALISCLISAYAQNVAAVYVGALFRGVVLGLGSTAIIANVVFNWFDKYRGLVMGAVFSGVGFGGATLMSVYTHWVSSSSIGWRQAYIYIGIIVFAASVIAALLLKTRPEDVGLTPFGKAESDEKGETKTKSSQEQTSLQAVLKTTSFYAAALIIFLINISLYAVYAHLDAYLQQRNFTTATIAAALSLLALAVGGGKLFYGVICDKFGLRVTGLVAAMFHVTSLCLLLFGQEKVSAIAGCIILGMGIGALQLSVSLFAGMFGKNYYSAVVGIFSGILGLAWGVGPWMTGRYFDSFGNYNGIFMVFILLGIVIGIISLMIPKNAGRQNTLKPSSSSN